MVGPSQIRAQWLTEAMLLLYLPFLVRGQLAQRIVRSICSTLAGDKLLRVENAHYRK
jgi:hypothetical protein